MNKWKRKLELRLVDFPKNTGVIHYRDERGHERDWFVGAVPGLDSEETMRAHLKRWRPTAKFIAWAIK